MIRECAHILGILAFLAWGSEVRSATVPDGFRDEAVRGGFASPMSLRFLPDGRMLVSERSPARVQLLSADGSLLLATALEIPNVPGNGERGLLSIEVDPQWPARPYLYAYYNLSSGGNTVVLARYTASGDLDGTGDGSLTFAGEMRLVQAIPDQCDNHNGGDLRFAPDGTLRLSVGDDENKCAAQALANGLGKILRLKVSDLPASGTVGLGDLVPPDNPFVDRPGAFEKLVWAYGLRNPFRMHVDPADGSIFVADVGENQREEVSHVEEGGVNLGWPYREGTLSVATSITFCACWACDCSLPLDFDPLSPIEDYGHARGRTVISAGVYRAPAGASHPWPAEYEGDYFYADFYQGYLRRLTGSGQSWTLAPLVPGQTNADFWATDLGGGGVDFELGPDGSLYYLNLNSGELRRIRHTGGVPAESTSFGTLKSLFGKEDGP